MEEDEDVIIEGGVLYSYLKDNGYSALDFETITLAKKKREMVIGENILRSQLMIPAWVQNHLSIIIKSGLLFDDHSSFVEAFIPSEVGENSSLKWSYLVTTGCWLSVAACAGLLKCGQCSTSNVFTASGFGVLFALYSTMKLHEQQKFNSSCRVLEKAIFKLEKLFIQLKKCTLIAQESEALLSKFKLQGIELLEFKKTVRFYGKKIVYYLSDLTEHLMQTIPLDANIDATAYCMNKEEIQTLLLDDHHEESVSVSTLKRIFNIYLLVQSEFLRRLALCYCPDVWLPQTKKQLSTLSTIYVSLEQWCSEVCLKLEKAIKVYEAFGGTYERKPRLKGTQHASGIRSDIYIAIRSSSLHMQSVLARSRELEDDLDTDYAENNSDKTVYYEGMHIALKDMLKDLRTIQDFLDDALVHVLKYKNSLEGVSLSEKESPIKYGEPKNKNDVEIIPEIEPLPPVEDEVFEAVVKRDEEDKGRFEDEMTLQEEREQREREKQKSLKVLSELKVVLKEKASEWKEREKLARQRKGCPVNVDEDDLGGEENYSPRKSVIKKYLNESSFDERPPELKSLDIKSLDGNRLGFLPTSNETNWPLPRLKNSILNPRKNIVRRVNPINSRFEQNKEENEAEEEVDEMDRTCLPGNAFDASILAEAMKKSLAFAERRREDCFGDSEEEDFS